MNSHENLVPAEGYRHVKMHPEARVALNATVIGDVELARDATVLPEAAIRADYGERIVIGEGSDVQEGCSLHVDAGFPLTVGRNVIIGHNATVHGCTVEDGVLIGMGAIVMNGVRVGKEALIGAGALVPEGREVPPGPSWWAFPPSRSARSPTRRLPRTPPMQPCTWRSESRWSATASRPPERTCRETSPQSASSKQPDTPAACVRANGGAKACSRCERTSVPHSPRGRIIRPRSPTPAQTQYGLVSQSGKRGRLFGASCDLRYCKRFAALQVVPQNAVTGLHRIDACEHARPAGQVVDDAHLMKTRLPRQLRRSIKASLVQLEGETAPGAKRRRRPRQQTAKDIVAVGAAVQGDAGSKSATSRGISASTAVGT